MPGGKSRAGRRMGAGLSLRGRGKPRQAVAGLHRKGSIPAWAGEAADASSGPIPWSVYPRVGGGSAVINLDAVAYSGLSPRGRGKRT